MPALEIRHLTLDAGKRRLIDCLDWQVEQGEFWCILGCNGAGKTSLLQTVAGLRHATQGEVRIAGRPLIEFSPVELARLRGLMPQQTVDSFSCTVFDAVAIGRTPWRLGRGWGSTDDAHRVNEALVQVGLQPRAGDDILSLSGGERQRVALAAMLVQAPMLMLLDEPTAHQDIGQQQQLMRLLRQSSARHAVVASCHDLNLAARFATHVLLLGDGFHRAGKVDEVMTPEALGAAFGCKIVERSGCFIPEET